MAGHPQNSPRGLFVKSGAISLGGQSVTGNSTGMTLAGGLALSGKTKFLTANSTATVIIPTVTTKPAARVVGGLCFVSNSTGKMLAYHSTGTTWKYASATSVLA
jgi:hypothetical protein